MPSTSRLCGQVTFRRPLSKKLVFFDLACNDEQNARLFWVELVVKTGDGLSLEDVRYIRDAIKLGDTVSVVGSFEATHAGAGPASSDGPSSTGSRHISGGGDDHGRSHADADGGGGGAHGGGGRGGGGGGGHGTGGECRTFVVAELVVERRWRDQHPNTPFLPQPAPRQHHPAGPPTARFGAGATSGAGAGSGVPGVPIRTVAAGDAVQRVCLGADSGAGGDGVGPVGRAPSSDEAAGAPQAEDPCARTSNRAATEAAAAAAAAATGPGAAAAEATAGSQSARGAAPQGRGICKYWAATGRCPKGGGGAAGGGCPYDHPQQRGGLAGAQQAYVRSRRSERLAAAAEMGFVHEAGDAAKRRRAAVLGDWIVRTYGREYLNSGTGVLDVAGGRGALTYHLLLHHGVTATLVEPRPAKLSRRQHRELAEVMEAAGGGGGGGGGGGEGGGDGSEAARRPAVLAAVGASAGGAAGRGADMVAGVAGVAGMARQDVRGVEREPAEASMSLDGLALPQARLRFDDRLWRTGQRPSAAAGAAATTAARDVAAAGADVIGAAVPAAPETVRDGGGLGASGAGEGGNGGLAALLRGCSLVVGLHPDQATDAVLDFALEAGRPFVLVPCCVFPRLFRHRRLEVPAAGDGAEQEVGDGGQGGGPAAADAAVADVSVVTGSGAPSAATAAAATGAPAEGLPPAAAAGPNADPSSGVSAGAAPSCSSTSTDPSSRWVPVESHAQLLAYLVQQAERRSAAAGGGFVFDAAVPHSSLEEGSSTGGGGHCRTEDGDAIDGLQRGGGPADSAGGGRVPGEEEGEPGSRGAAEWVQQQRLWRMLWRRNRELGLGSRPMGRRPGADAMASVGDDGAGSPANLAAGTGGPGSPSSEAGQPTAHGEEGFQGGELAAGPGAARGDLAARPLHATLRWLDGQSELWESGVRGRDGADAASEGADKALGETAGEGPSARVGGDGDGDGDGTESDNGDSDEVDDEDDRGGGVAMRCGGSVEGDAEGAASERAGRAPLPYGCGPGPVSRWRVGTERLQFEGANVAVYRVPCGPPAAGLDGGCVC